ncbi:hypothetical protein J6590_042225 [Homalodisca vitripennis]|nr:hypothetical protein J6590_042225 [Homalodisca vitripennis]
MNCKMEISAKLSLLEINGEPTPKVAIKEFTQKVQQEERQAEKGRQETTPSCHLRHVTILVGDGSGATNIVGEADNNQHHLSTASSNHGSRNGVATRKTTATVNYSDLVRKGNKRNEHVQITANVQGHSGHSNGRE